jgi:hypothetical protein
MVEELEAIDRLRDPNAVNTLAQRLYAGAPFQHVRPANTLAAARDALNCAASPYGALRRQMARWAIAAADPADRALYDDALDVLLRNGGLAYGYGMTRSRWLAQAGLWSRYGLAIHDYVTKPYLRGNSE